MNFIVFIGYLRDKVNRTCLYRRYKITMQKITVFQQKGRGRSKIKGIERLGDNMFDLSIISIEDSLPSLLDDTSQYLPKEINSDLVLDFLVHPDLSHDLAILCQAVDIPIIASGRRIDVGRAITPST
jgi:hypothetical protein